MGKLCKILLVSAMLLVGGCSSKESEKKEPVSDNTEKTTLKITIQVVTPLSAAWRTATA